MDLQPIRGQSDNKSTNQSSECHIPADPGHEPALVVVVDGERPGCLDLLADPVDLVQIVDVHVLSTDALAVHVLQSSVKGVFKVQIVVKMRPTC